MSLPSGDREHVLRLMRSALDALEGGDEGAYKQQLDEISQWRSAPVFDALERLAREISSTIGGLPTQGDPALAELPDASARLEKVVEMTEEASHKTLDLTDQSRKLVDQLAVHAMDDEAQELVRQLRANLSDITLAQSYQDLTGQVIRRVVEIVGKVQLVMRVTGIHPKAGEGGSPTAASGPALKGLDRHAVSQDDADSLLSDLGL